MTPEKKQEVKLQHAQAKTQRMAILTAEGKARRKMQHSKNQEKFREAMTPEVKQEVKMRGAQAKTQLRKLQNRKDKGRFKKGINKKRYKPFTCSTESVHMLYWKRAHAQLECVHAHLKVCTCSTEA